MGSDLSLREKAAFIAASCGKDLPWWFLTGYLLFYLTDVQGLNPVTVALLAFLFRLPDLLLDPLSGWLFDNSKGRTFLPAMILGVALCALSLSAMFFNIENPTANDVGWLAFFLCFTLWGAAYTLTDMPYWSAVPSLSLDAKIRDKLSTLPRSCALTGGQLLLCMAVPFMMWVKTDLKNRTEGFFILSCLCALIFALTVLPSALMVISRALKNKVHVKLKDSLSLVRHSDQFQGTVCIALLFNVSCSLLYAGSIFYFKYVRRNLDLFACVMGFGAVCSLIAFAVYSKLAAKSGRRKVFKYSLWLMIFGFLGLFIGSFGDIGSKVWVFLFYAILSCGIALASVSITVMFADSVDYSELICGKRCAGTVFSLQSLTVKMGMALSLLILGCLLGVCGYVPNGVQSDALISSLACGMFLLPAAGIMLTLYVYTRKSSLHDDLFKNTLSALDVSKDERIEEDEGRFLLDDILKEDLIMLNAKATSSKEIILKLIDLLEEKGCLADRREFENEVFKRERAGATGLAMGVAMPHGKSSAVLKTSVAAARLMNGVNFHAPDGKVCDLIFLLASKDSDLHLNLIGRLSLKLNQDGVINRLRRCQSASEFADILKSGKNKAKSD